MCVSSSQSAAVFSLFWKVVMASYTVVCISLAAVYHQLFAHQRQLPLCQRATWHQITVYYMAVTSNASSAPKRTDLCSVFGVFLVSVKYVERSDFHRRSHEVNVVNICSWFRVYAFATRGCCDASLRNPTQLHGPADQSLSPELTEDFGLKALTLHQLSFASICLIWRLHVPFGLIETS